MSSAAEAEMVGLLITAKTMVSMRQTLIEMGWTQAKSPIQTYNSTAAGATNNEIVAKYLNYMDMILWWLRC